MGIINLIRKNGSLLVGTIAISLLFFVLSQGISGIMPILYGTRNKFYIGEIAGKKINYHDFDKVLNRFRSQFAKENRKPKENIQDIVWNNYVREMVEEYMYSKEYQKLGLNLSHEEIIDMVQGEHIHSFIKKSFLNKETKEFDKSALLNYLQSLPSRSENEQRQWHYIESRIMKMRLANKLNSMMSGSIFITDLELADENKFEYSSLDLKTLFIPYDSISDEDVTITDDMLNQYMKENHEKYKVKDSVDILYAIFPIKPSDEDDDEIKRDIEALIEKFKKSKDSLSFAQTHSDSSEAYTHQTFKYRDLRKKFPKIRRWRRGKVIGPIKESDNVYRIYKLFKIRQKGKSYDYEMAIIEKHITTSDKTKDMAFRKADVFANNVKDKKTFEEETKKNNIETHFAKQITKSSKNAGNLENARSLVRWLYGKGNKNKISPVFEIDENYVVAIPTKYSKEGLTDLNYVKEEIKQEVLKLEKAKIIKSKFKIDKEQTLKKAAKEYGKSAKIIRLKNIHFKDDSLDKIGDVEKAIGIAFSLKNKGDRSKVFADKNGILVLELNKRENSGIENQEAHKIADIKAEIMMEPYNVYLALEDKANIKDNRSDFY